ncbi:hypothetical protein [Spirosoma flavus]
MDLYTLIWLGCKPHLGTSVLSHGSCPTRSAHNALSDLNPSAKPLLRVEIQFLSFSFTTVGLSKATYLTHFVLPCLSVSIVTRNQKTDPTPAFLVSTPTRPTNRKAFLTSRAACHTRPDRYVVFLPVVYTQHPQGLMDNETTPDNKRSVNLYTPVWLGCRLYDGT